MKKITVYILVLSLVGIGLAGCGEPEGPADPDIIALAQCLTDKGYKMYGAVWCGHCKQQKDLFGSAFEHIDYIECDPNTNTDQAKICVEKGISNVPAWEYPDGTMVVGKKSLEDLKNLSGC